MRSAPVPAGPAGRTILKWSGSAGNSGTARSWPPRDVSIADLIGEIDPIKVAEGRYLADEETIHYGLIPRTNRGVFAVNELPDLTEKVQVGLFNLMEEKGRPDQGIQDPPSPRRDHRGQREPRGLHQPRPHHHALEGSLRRADQDALPASGRARDRHHGAGVGPAGRPQPRRDDPRLHEGGAGPPDLRGAQLERDQPVVRGQRPHQHQQLREHDQQRGEARAAVGGNRHRAAGERSPRRAPLHLREDRGGVRGRGEERGRVDRAAS